MIIIVIIELKFWNGGFGVHGAGLPAYRLCEKVETLPQAPQTQKGSCEDHWHVFRELYRLPFLAGKGLVDEIYRFFLKLSELLQQLIYVGQQGLVEAVTLP